MTSALLTAARSTETAIKHVAHGLESADIDFLARKLDVPLERLADLAGIPRSTFFKRHKHGHFLVPESEHIMRFAILWTVAYEVFPTEHGARSWLGRPQIGLDGIVPLDYAKSELGARAVEDLMLRIHHGLLA